MNNRVCIYVMRKINIFETKKQLQALRYFLREVNKGMFLTKYLD